MGTFLPLFSEALTHHTEPTLNHTLTIQLPADRSWTQQLPIQAPGVLTITAETEDPQLEIGLMLYRTGELKYCSRKDGKGKLHMQYAISEHELLNKKGFKIALRHFGFSKTARAKVSWSFQPKEKEPPQGRIEKTLTLGSHEVEEIALNIKETGEIEATVEWTPATRNFSVKLIGPDGSTYQTLRGRSPIKLSYDVQQADLNAGNNWIVAVANAGAFELEVHILILYPEAAMDAAERAKREAMEKARKEAEAQKRRDESPGAAQITLGRKELIPSKDGMYWSEVKMDYDTKDMTVKPPKLGQKVDKEHPTVNRMRFRPPQGQLPGRNPIRPVAQRFEYLDPVTKEPVSGDEEIIIQVGEDEYAKVPARQYYDYINELERRLNAQGYSLDDSLTLDTTKTYEIPLSPVIQSTLNRQYQQFRTDSIQKVKTIERLKKEGRYLEPVYSAEPLRKRFLYRQQAYPDRNERLKKVFKIRPNIITRDLPRVAKEETNSFKELEGKEELFAIYMEGRQTLQGDKDFGVAMTNEAQAGVYIFGMKTTLVDFSSYVEAPVEGGKPNRTVSAKVNGFSLGVPISSDQHVPIESKGLERSEELSYQSTFIVGLIPVTVKAGTRFSAGLDFDINSDPLNAYGFYRPKVAAEAFAQAGVDVIILEVGVYCRLLLLESAMNFSSEVFISDESPEFEDQNQYVFQYGVNSEYTALSGEVGIYIELWVVFATKRWDLPLFKWDGISTEGYLGEAPRVVYCLVDDPEDCKKNMTLVPPAVGSDWNPAENSMLMLASEAQPEMAEFNGDLVHVTPVNDGRLAYRQLKASRLAKGKLEEDLYNEFSSKVAYLPGIDEAQLEQVEMVVFGDYLYVFFKEIYRSDHGIKYVALNKNNNWTPAFWVGSPVATSWMKPAATVFNNQLFLFYTKPGDSKIYYVTGKQAFQAAIQWSEERLLTNGFNTDVAPAAATHINTEGQERLLLFFKSFGRKNLNYLNLDQKAFSLPPEAVAKFYPPISLNAASTHAPEVCSFDQSVYVLFKGENDAKIYYKWIDPYYQWSGQYVIPFEQQVRNTTETNGQLSAAAVGKALLINHMHAKIKYAVFGRLLPSDWLVTAYKQADFRGLKNIYKWPHIPQLNEGKSRLNQWDNSIRSIRIPDGCTVTLFENENYNRFGGTKKTVLKGNANNLAKWGMASNASSMRIDCKEPTDYAVSNKVVLYSGTHYTGQYLAIPQNQELRNYYEVSELDALGLKDWERVIRLPEEEPDLTGGNKYRIGSIYVPEGCTVTFFGEHDGKMLTRRIESSNDNTVELLKNVSSMVVYCQPK